MAKNKPLKLIIDTNLWISFIISKKQGLLDPLLSASRVRLLFSKELLSELQQTITKPKLKKYFGSNALREMLLAFEPFIDLVEVTASVTICRDSKDNFLLALAKDGSADYLLTGDKDLLDMQKFGKTKITTIANFIEGMKTRN